MIRILHLVPNLNIGNGIMSVVMNYYRNINKDIIQFDFCYFQDSSENYINEIQQLGGSVYKISRPNVNFNYVSEIKKILEYNKGSNLIFHSHLVFLTFLFTPVLKKNGVNKIINHSHNSYYSDKFFSNIRNRILKLTVNYSANTYLSCSKLAGTFLFGEKKMSANKVVILNNAINVKKFAYNDQVRQSVRKKIGVENNLVIGNVGRFAHQKNHDFLIDIFKEIKMKNANAKLVLVGNGQLEDKIKEKVAKYSLEKDVLFLGKRNNINEILQAFDIFVLPSLYEGLPVVAVEAQASGLPIVLSENITREIGIGTYKYLSLNDTPKEWSNNIININKRNVRENSFKILEKNGFDIEIESKKLEKIYINI